MKIYNTFLKPDAEKEVNIGASLRAKLKTLFASENLVLKKGTFRESKDAVMITLRDDNLMRYLKSDIYKNFIQKMQDQQAQRTPSSNQPAKKKSSSSSSSSNDKKKNTGNEFKDDVYELMFKVYEDVKREEDYLLALQQAEEQSSSPPLVVTDFEMFLANEGNELYMSQSIPRKTKTPKKKEPKEAKTPNLQKEKKPSFLARMTMTEQRRRKKEDDSSSSGNRSDKLQNSKKGRSKGSQVNTPNSVPNKSPANETVEAEDDNVDLLEMLKSK
jgi:hypothetical protein